MSGFLIIHEDELKGLKPGFKALSRAPLASNEPSEVKSCSTDSCQKE